MQEEALGQKEQTRKAGDPNGIFDGEHTTDPGKEGLDLNKKKHIHVSYLKFKKMFTTMCPPTYQAAPFQTLSHLDNWLRIFHTNRNLGDWLRDIASL